MKKIANQILYNLKKEKTSFISFGVIILITALILNCAAVLLCQVDRAYDTKFEKLSTAMLNAIVPEVQNSSELEKAIDESFMRRQHGDIWKVAQTPEEAVELLYSTPVWDISIRKFAAI